jgi:hypothetical protein
METINLWPVIIASFVGFGISSLWYSPFLFGTSWIALNEKANSYNVSSKKIWISYIVHIIFSIVSFSIIYFALKLIGTSTVLDGAFVGFIAWLGFILPTDLGDYIWQKNSFKLFLINTVCSLLVTIVGTMIIVAW